MRIACVGEAMVELALEPVPSTWARVGFAGDTLNTAIYLKRAAPSLEISFVTRLGRDAFSARMLDFIAAEGVSTADITFSETRRPGLYAITTDPDGERSFTYWRESSAAREMFQTAKSVSFDALAGYDLVYLSAITLAILPDRVLSELFNWVAGFRAKGGQIAFDSNYRPALWPDAATARRVIGRMWELCDIALPSIDDEMAIFGDQDAGQVLARLRRCGVRSGVLKRGAKGPVALAGGIEAAPFQPAPAVIDTTAAGDSFNAGYLADRLTGASEAEALQAGHRLAARVVGVKGAIAPR